MRQGASAARRMSRDEAPWRVFASGVLAGASIFASYAVASTLVGGGG